MQLVLFDFDGTLTRRDTFPDFLLYTFGWRGILLRLPRMGRLGWRIGRLEGWTNASAKKAILAACFGGWHREELAAAARDWNNRRLPQLLRPDILSSLRSFRDAGDQVAVVSASVDVWLKPFCEAEQLTLICTEIEYRDNCFSGNFATPNCNGAEKARRIQATFDLSRFTHIIALGNSKGDRAMYALAHEVRHCQYPVPRVVFKNI